MSAHNDLGRAGEELAARFLESQGLRVLERNWRGRAGEIDLICEDAATLVFVEVKTRSSSRFGSPEEALDPRKLARLHRSAEEYQARSRGAERPCRLDLVAICRRRNGQYSVRHIEGLTLD